MQQMELVTWIEKQLCELVDRLRAMGHRHTLEAELRFSRLKGDLSEGDFAELLPEFREKGVLTVTNTSPGGGVLHSSTHKR